MGDELRDLRGEYESRRRRSRLSHHEPLCGVAVERAVDLCRPEDLGVLG